MCLKSHISKLCKSLNYKIYSIGKIRKYLDKETTKTLVNSSVTSKMDYCNSLLYGLDDVTLRPIQLIQNNAARVITRQRKRDHITPALRNLHWLPVRHRISYKVLLLTYKCRVGKGPKYLTDLLTTYVPSRIPCALKNRTQSIDSIIMAGELLFEQLPHYGTSFLQISEKCEGLDLMTVMTF